MTATSIGISEPIKFFGAYVRNISTNLGLSTSSSTATITLVEDAFDGVLFDPPAPGTFVEIEIGPTWKFSGIFQKYTIDVRNISGRQISITINDARDVMRAIPMIIAPGFSDIATIVNDNTGCSVLDIYGAYDDLQTGLNLSGYTDAGMLYERLRQAIEGESINFSDLFTFTVPQVVAKAFGEQYRFDMTEVNALVDRAHLFNSNLITVAQFIEDLSNKHAFDWYVDSQRAGDGIVDVTIRTIDRSVDNEDIDLDAFLTSKDGKVISATSGLELRNDISCSIVQGALVEQLSKVSIRGLANEPVDLTAVTGSNVYTMTETEMRCVLAGRSSWETWIDIPGELGGGGGFQRYGGILSNQMLQNLLRVGDAANVIINGGNIPKNAKRTKEYLASIDFATIGRVYDQLKGHAESTYGKRWVHDSILNEIIESSWTRDVVAGNDDPNEFFRQEDGRTRAYVEFSSEDAGGAFSLGLNNLTNLFGSADPFRNVTAFGRTFSNVFGGTSIDGTLLNLELSSNFNAQKTDIDMDKSNYIFNNTAQPQIPKTSLYVAGTTDKDGVISISDAILEDTPNTLELLNSAIIASRRIVNGEVDAVEEVTFPDGSKGVVRVQEGDDLIEFREVESEDGVGIISVDTSDDLIEVEAGGGIGLVKKRDLQAFKKDADDNDEEEVRSSFLKIIRMLGISLYEMHSRCYQPKFAYIPTRSRTLRYGPAFPSDISPESFGKLEIIQDDGFAPWEFGSISAMQDALQKKVDAASSQIKNIQTAQIIIEGLPDLNLGQSLGFNSNINGLSISFGSDGVRTSYQLQSFTKKFGELTKEDIVLAAILDSNAGRRQQITDQTGFNERHMVNVNKNFGSGGKRRQSGTKGGVRNFG